MQPRSTRVSLAPFTFRDTAAEKGALRVPVRHSQPDGAVLELPFVRLAGAPGGMPLVFLTGGPGLSGIRSAQGRLFPMFDALRACGDVILLDQRACVADGMVSRKPSSRFRPLTAPSRAEYLDEIRATIGRGIEELSARGIPLDALNTRESADDVAMLVRELHGNDARAALLGWSYGSHLAMAVIKRHEDVVARAVLAAPEGPDHTLKRPRAIQDHIEYLSRRTATDLSGMLMHVLDRAERETPLIFGHTDSPAVGRFDMQWVMSELVADTRAMPKLPEWLARMERGDFLVMGEDRLLRGALETLRHEMLHGIVRYAFDCASGSSAARRALIEREAKETLLGDTIDFPTPDVCDAVGCPDLGDEFRAAPRAQTPVLFVTGTLDCRTPAANVADLTPGLPQHMHAVVEGAGHGDLLLATPAQSAILAFLRERR